MIFFNKFDEYVFVGSLANNELMVDTLQRFITIRWRSFIEL